MLCCLSRFFAAAVLGLVFLGTSLAQEQAVPPIDGATAEEAAADPAKKYEELKKSKNRAIKALAERYDDLMSLQEWTDVTGRHKVKARYVEHDPDLKWVRLSTSTGSGDKAVVKESTIPLSKLSKASQGKVRQIAALERKLDELTAEEEANPAGVADSARSGEYARGERGMRGDRYDRGAGIPGDQLGGPSADASIDRTQWATNYDAFRANFAFGEDANGQRGLDWGELRQLKAVADAATEKRRPGDTGGERARAEVAPSLGEVGEIHWEAPLVKVRQVKSDGEAQFRVPPLPRQIKLRFLIDEQDSYDTWAKLPLNEPVNFAGRFESVKPHQIVLRIRLDTEPPKTVAPYEATSGRR